MNLCVMPRGLREILQGWVGELADYGVLAAEEEDAVVSVVEEFFGLGDGGEDEFFFVESFCFVGGREGGAYSGWACHVEEFCCCILEFSEL